MHLHKVRVGLEVCLGLCVFILLTGSTSGSAVRSFSDDDVSTSGVSDWSKRRWDMKRLGRGLHMLRLGKRDSETSLRLARDVPMLRLERPPSADDDVSSPPHSVPLHVGDQLLAILKDVLEQQSARDETRRQPPLPRYGRRSSGLARRNLDSGSSADRANRVFPFDFTAEDDPVYRPPPRGGRYKRAVATSLSRRSTTYQQKPTGGLPAVYFPGLATETDQRLRSVALPRIGRYLEGKEHDRITKAVPHPRIGRDEVPDSGTGSGRSKQAGSGADPMVDPRQV